MTDRELLEKAAKAAGEKLFWDNDGTYFCDLVTGTLTPWNPLTDDGDALRLAVKLRLCITVSTSGQSVEVETYGVHVCETHPTNDPCITTRRAIVRAAAATGETA